MKKRLLCRCASSFPKLVGVIQLTRWDLNKMSLRLGRVRDTLNLNGIYRKDMQRV